MITQSGKGTGSRTCDTASRRALPGQQRVPDALYRHPLPAELVAPTLPEVRRALECACRGHRVLHDDNTFRGCTLSRVGASNGFRIVTEYGGHSLVPDDPSDYVWSNFWPGCSLVAVNGEPMPSAPALSAVVGAIPRSLPASLGFICERQRDAATRTVYFVTYRELAELVALAQRLEIFSDEKPYTCDARFNRTVTIAARRCPEQTELSPESRGRR